MTTMRAMNTHSPITDTLASMVVGDTPDITARIRLAKDKDIEFTNPPSPVGVSFSTGPTLSWLNQDIAVDNALSYINAVVMTIDTIQGKVIALVPQIVVSDDTTTVRDPHISYNLIGRFTRPAPPVYGWGLTVHSLSPVIVENDTFRETVAIEAAVINALMAQAVTTGVNEIRINSLDDVNAQLPDNGDLIGDITVSRWEGYLSHVPDSYLSSIESAREHLQLTDDENIEIHEHVLTLGTKKYFFLDVRDTCHPYPRHHSQMMWGNSEAETAHRLEVETIFSIMEKHHNDSVPRDSDYPSPGPGQEENAKIVLPRIISYL